MFCIWTVCNEKMTFYESTSYDIHLFIMIVIIIDTVRLKILPEVLSENNVEKEKLTLTRRTRTSQKCGSLSYDWSSETHLVLPLMRYTETGLVHTGNFLPFLSLSMR